MSEQQPDLKRRRFLTAAAVVVGGAGGAFAAVPFVVSWLPSARARAAGAPVEVDVSQLVENQLLRVMWRGQPVFIVKRSEALLKELEGVEDRLKDPANANKDQQPAYADNRNRSQEAQMLVVLGVCTHLGCAPQLVPVVEPQPFDSDWRGGFFCPCHNSRFDISGRVYNGSPAAANLVVPPHRYASATRIVVGEDPTEGQS